MRIDFVSDIACPWCAIGLNSLERALEKLGDEVNATLVFHPFELNPTMGPQGARLADYLRDKYGMSAAQFAQSQQELTTRGASVGFAFGEREWIWNTFDAHRMLYLAGQQDGTVQRRLKHAMLATYHGQGKNPGESATLLALAESAGVERVAAQHLIASDQYAEEVRAEEEQWQQAGIRSVPSIIINQRHLITGGQTPAVFERVLRDIANAPVQPA